LAFLLPKIFRRNFMTTLLAKRALLALLFVFAGAFAVFQSEGFNTHGQPKLAELKKNRRVAHSLVIFAAQSR
jgi:uncharacterized membrane protein YgdD (TMEM256/DUF423 family)